MRNEATAALVTILVVIAASVGFFVGQNLSGVQTTTSTTTFFQPCEGQEAWDTSMNSSLVPVLLMQPNTTAYACVVYQTIWKGDPDYNFTGFPGLPFGVQQFQPFYPFQVHCTPTTSTGRGLCPSESTHSLVVSVFPTSANLTLYTNYVVVRYTITALSNSTGYYVDTLPWQACDSMPMAVGHAVSEVNASDFGAMPSSQCGVPWVYSISVSVSGMGVTYLLPL